VSIPPVAVSAFLVATLAAACAGGPVHVQNEQHVVEAQRDHETLSYRYGPVPGSWRAIEIEGNDVAWLDRDTDGVVHVDHSCANDQDVPLPSLVQHLLIGFTEREFVTEETIPFDGRDARHVVVRARLDGVPTMLELYVMKKDGCVYDIGFVAPPARFSAGQPAFTAFVQGFATIHTGLPSTASRGASP
jgi:hypothetical protein